MGLHGVDLRMGEHAPIADKDEAVQSEAVFQRFDLIGNGGGITGIAGIDADGDRTALMVGEHPVDDDRFPFLAIPVMAELGKGTGPSLVVAARHVVEHGCAFREVLRGELLLDRLLTGNSQSIAR